MAAERGAVNIEVVQRMSAALVHRGPDSMGIHADAQAALAIRRLAIIDVQGGDQPIANEDGSVVVVLNGEIYNFQELRRTLEARGHRFRTDSDTEVVVHLYEDRGPSLVHELRGMFAFALWDAVRQRLVLARDRVGKKPLYYWQTDGRLSFASELAALLEDPSIPRRVDPTAIDAYIALLYVPHPLSAIEGVRKLPPASTLVWQDGRACVDEYWRLRYDDKDHVDPEDVRERVREAVRDAVGVRLMSERPLGAFLSGGVDSALVVATMAELSSGPVKTFTIGFTSERFNELPYAKQIAELYGTDHTEYVVEPDALSVLPKLVTHYGDPFGDSSAIPSFFVAKAAAEHVTVALNGDGGDESFAGYNRYVSNQLAERLDAVPVAPRRALARVAASTREPVALMSWPARIRRIALSLPLPPDRRYASRMTYTDAALRRDLYDESFLERLDLDYPEQLLAGTWRASNATNPVDRMLDVDVQTYLPGDLLVKMDIATMANSLEARSPLLDHRLMEMAARLPASAKVRGTTTKVALKQAARGLVPDALLDRPKWGFSVPLAEWFRGPLTETVRSVLLDPLAHGRHVFEPAAVERLLEEHASGRADRSSQLWLLLVLELWQRRFLDGLPESALF